MALIDVIERQIRRVGFVTALILLPAMMIARLTEITTRSMNIPGSLFNAMEAEFFLLFAFLIAGAAAVSDGHVRVDIFRDRFGPRVRAWIDILGTVVFVIPFTAAVMWYGLLLTGAALEDGERAAMAMGAPLRWLVVFATPFGIWLLALAVICRAVRQVAFLVGRGPEP